MRRAGGRGSWWRGGSPRPGGVWCARLDRHDAAARAIVEALVEVLEAVEAHVAALDRGEAAPAQAVAGGEQGFAEEQRVADGVDHPRLGRDRIGRQRQVGQRQAGEVALALLEREAEQVGRMVAGGAVGGGTTTASRSSSITRRPAPEPAPPRVARRTGGAGGARCGAGARAGREGERVVDRGREARRGGRGPSSFAGSCGDPTRQSGMPSPSTTSSSAAEGRSNRSAPYGDALAIAGDRQVVEVGGGVGGGVVVRSSSVLRWTLMNSATDSGLSARKGMIMPRAFPAFLALDAVGLAAAVLRDGWRRLVEARRPRQRRSAACGAGVESPATAARAGWRAMAGRRSGAATLPGACRARRIQLLAFGLGGPAAVEPGALGDHRVVAQAAVACLDARPAREGAQGVRPGSRAQLVGGSLVDRLVGHEAERRVAVAILREGAAATAASQR